MLELAPLPHSVFTECDESMKIIACPPGFDYIFLSLVLMNYFLICHLHNRLLPLTEKHVGPIIPNRYPLLSFSLEEWFNVTCALIHLKILIAIVSAQQMKLCLFRLVHLFELMK